MTGWITVAEAADRLGVSRQAVLKRIRTGALHARSENKAGRLVRWWIDPATVAPIDDRPAGGFVSVAEAAELLGRDVRTVRRYIEAGHLAAMRPHGIWWLSAADVAAFQPPALGRPTEGTR